MASTDERDGYRRVMLLIPEPFSDAWRKLVELCQDFKGFDPNARAKDRWPILALTAKAAHTTLSIALLAAMRQWPDAWVLGRSLFETEILVKWLCESRTDHRIKEYLEAIDEEKSRLQRKVPNGRSVATQVMRDIIPPKASEISAESANKKKRGRRSNVRDRSKFVNLERSYELPYWTASIFAHSNALSLSQWNPILKAEDSPFVEMFSFSDKGLASWLVLEGSPSSVLETFALTDHCFQLGLSREISDTRKLFNEVISKVSGGRVMFSAPERGQVIVQFTNGTSRTYKSPRTGRDPFDELP